MDMEVIIHSGATGAAEIPPEIEALSLDAFRQELLGENAETPEIDYLIIGKVFHIGGLAVRNGHEMPGGVGVFVHDEEGGLPPGDHKMRLVIRRAGRLGKKVVRGAVLGLEVFHAPGGPE